MKHLSGRRYLFFLLPVIPSISVLLACSIRLCMMDSALGVLRRRIDRGKHQGAVPGIKDIVPRAAWHENAISCAEAVTDVQVFPARSHADHSLSAFYADELIRVGMHFHADVAAGRDTHQRHLQMMSRPKRAAKIMVMPRRARYIYNKWIAPVIRLTAALHWMMRVHVICSFPFPIQYPMQLNGFR